MRTISIPNEDDFVFSSASNLSGVKAISGKGQLNIHFSYLQVILRSIFPSSIKEQSSGSSSLRARTFEMIS